MFLVHENIFLQPNLLKGHFQDKIISNVVLVFPWGIIRKLSDKEKTFVKGIMHTPL